MKRINKTAYSIAFLFILIFSLILTVTVSGSAVARASTSTVLDDLRKDSNFNIWDYPVNDKDYSIYVIQIAESNGGNLYLYTYQPFLNSKIMYATDINMSLSEDVTGTKLYELEFVNADDVFCKYLVKGVKVNDNATRYYNITSIYREWDNGIDGKTGTNNKGEKKAYAVQNIYKVRTENGEKKYSCEPTYVVNILNPYADFLLYTNSKSLPAIPSIKHSFEKLGFIDAHYIAFSTDWEIDKLLSATVTYVCCSASATAGQFAFFPGKSETTYGKEEICYAYPTYEDKAEVSGSSWTGRKYSYSWDRIQSVSEFISTESNLTDETKTNLKDRQWVLRFAETKRAQTERNVLGYKEYQIDWTEVKKVSVLRLEFETDGKVYNLGAVSDSVSGDEFPGNAGLKEKGNSFLDKCEKVFKYLWTCILKMFKGTASTAETVVAVLSLIVALVVFALTVAFIKWLYRKLFK